METNFIQNNNLNLVYTVYHVLYFNIHFFFLICIQHYKLGIKMSRNLPNIIITGTPGSGKTSHAHLLTENLSELKYFSMNEIAREKNAVVGFDKDRQSTIVDEEKLAEAIEDDLNEGGVIIDWHVCDPFPEELIDLVVVLRVDNQNLYDRLQKRNYSQKKIDENLDVEIMEVIVEDAKASYAPEVIIELQSNSVEDMESNVERIVTWYKNWKQNNENSDDE